MRFLFLPGDGIGPEVSSVARAVLDWFVANRGLDAQIDEAPVGGAALDAHGDPAPPATMEKARAADVVFLGAVGGPAWADAPFAVRPEAGLLRLRAELKTFANLRPARTPPALVAASPLRPELARALDMVIVRELTGGVYFGEPRGVETGADGRRRGVNTHVYDDEEIARIARVGFELARARGRGLMSVDKANVMEAGALWREVVSEVGAKEFPDVSLEHMLADACAMVMARDPARFDVVVTDNLFGDLLSDLAAALTGSLGLAPSASLGAPDAGGRARGLYEPVHGSAPDVAGRDVANPLAAVLSLALALRYSCARPEDADLLEAAVDATLNQGARTADVAVAGETPLGCAAMGEAVVAQLTKLAREAGA